VTGTRTELLRVGVLYRYAVVGVELFGMGANQAIELGKVLIARGEQIKKGG